MTGAVTVTVVVKFMVVPEAVTVVVVVKFIAVPEAVMVFGTVTVLTLLDFETVIVVVAVVVAKFVHVREELADKYVMKRLTMIKWMRKYAMKKLMK